MRGLDLRPIEQVTRQEKHVRSFPDRSLRDVGERLSEIRLRQPAIQPPAAEVDIGAVNDFHAGADVIRVSD